MFQIQLSKKHSYQLSLQTKTTTLPDPMELTEGWVGEREGMKLWPATMFFDIINFMGVKGNDSSGQLMQEYKTGKGFSYLYSGKYMGVLTKINYIYVHSIIM